MQLILSLFTGIGLLDDAFRKAGFCIVSAGDLITGQDIRHFTTTKGKFDGVIGSPPCEDFSTRQRQEDRTNYSLEMLEEYKRIISEADPKWWLLESNRTAPNLFIDGYNHQRTTIDQAWYEPVRRSCIVQFGCKTNQHIQIPREIIKLSNIKYKRLTVDASFSEIKYMKGLPDTFNLPMLNVVAKKKLLSSSVPLSVGKVIAEAIKEVTAPEQKPSILHRKENELSSLEQRYCACGCGTKVFGLKKYYSSACRKVAQRNRDRLKKLANT